MKPTRSAVRNDVRCTDGITRENISNAGVTDGLMVIWGISPSRIYSVIIWIIHEVNREVMRLIGSSISLRRGCTKSRKKVRPRAVRSQTSRFCGMCSPGTIVVVIHNAPRCMTNSFSHCLITQLAYEAITSFVNQIRLGQPLLTQSMMIR